MMIKIIRLKSGEDIIAFIQKTEKDTVLVYDPLLVYIEYNTKKLSQNLVLGHWLPKSLVKENVAEIKISEVLLFLEPKEEIKEYYENFLEQIETVSKPSEEKKQKREKVKETIH